MFGGYLARGPSLFWKKKIIFVHTSNNNHITTRPIGATLLSRSQLLSLVCLFLTKALACAEIQWSCPAIGHRESHLTVSRLSQIFLALSIFPPVLTVIRAHFMFSMKSVNGPTGQLQYKYI